MRNPERIPVIIEKFKEYWLLNPDLRFGQIVENMKHDFNCDFFYVEDDKFEAELDRLLDKERKK